MKGDKKFVSSKNLNIKESKKQFDSSRSTAMHKSKTVTEKLSNENFYKNDVRYQMNSLLNFESPIDEENSHKDVLDRFQNLSKISITILCLLFVNISFSNFKDIIIFIITFSAYLLVVYLSWAKENREKINTIPLLAIINKINSNLDCGALIKFLIEFLLALFLIFRINFTEVSIHTIGGYFLPMFLINAVLDVSIESFMRYELSEKILILCLIDYPDSNFLMRFIYNLFSEKSFVVFFIFCGCILFYYSFKKGMRELWALYDSFKRSYFIIKKTMFDDFPYPIFIVAKKTNNPIIYKNSKGELLIKQIKEMKISNGAEKMDQGAKKQMTPQFGSQKLSTFSRRIQATKTGIGGIKKDELLEEIFLDKELENIFINELEKCVTNKKKFFDFPLNIDDSKKINFHQNSKKITFFDENLENLEWYRVVVSHCFWKSQESYYIQMIRNEDINWNNFTTEYYRNMRLVCDNYLENLDKFCDSITNIENPGDRKGMGLISNPNLSNVMGGHKNETISFAFNKSTKTSPFDKSTPESNLNANKTFKRQTTNVPTHLNVPTLNQYFNPNYIVIYSVPQFDHTVWFFSKYQGLYINNMLNTIRLFDSLIHKRLINNYLRVNIKVFFNYLHDFFHVPCRLKNFKLVFNNHSNEEELVINYHYFRCVIFNVILFIINNSNDSNHEKTIEINITSQKEISEEEFIIKFNIKYIDDKSKINMNDLSQIIKNRTKGNINYGKNSQKIKLVDVGIITAYFILNQIYGNDLILLTETSTHFISFNLKGKFQRDYSPGSIQNQTYSYLKLKEPKTKISEQYYNKILHKIFKINPPLVSKIFDVRGILNKIESNKDLKKCFPSFSHSKSDLTTGIEPETVSDKLLPEEINVKIDLDRNITRETNICLSKHFDNYDKLLEEKMDKNEKILNILKKSRQLKFYVEDLKKFNHLDKIKFDVDYKSKVKYFYPPRFLIVEDNAFGRINLIDILKKQKLDFLIDIAAYGRESVQKFKFFLNRGFIYDIIFMDINLLDMLGSDAARIMREYEAQNPNIHTNIVAVSVEGKKNVMSDNIFDNYFEKPIKAEEFVDYIFKHLSRNRPEIKL